MAFQNEHLFISHFHAPEDGYVYLEESEWLSDGQLSASSVIHKPKNTEKKGPRVSEGVSTFSSRPSSVFGF